jgi:hypothetical protein
MGTPCAGFIVDPHFSARKINGISVHRSAVAFAGDSSVRFVIALGDPIARARVAAELERLSEPASRRSFTPAPGSAAAFASARDPWCLD